MEQHKKDKIKHLSSDKREGFDRNRQKDSVERTPFFGLLEGNTKRSLKTSSPDKKARFFEKKTEKIALALYLVSGLLKDKEPIKWKIRESAVVLLESARGTDHEGQFTYDNEHFIQVIHEVITLLDIARASGMISEMNHTILRQECLRAHELSRSVDAQREKNRGVLFDEFFFEADSEDERSSYSEKSSAVLGGDSHETSIPPRRDTGYAKGHDKGQQSKGHRAGSLPARKEIKRSNTGATTVLRSGRDKLKEKRKDAILDVFQKNKGNELTIRDVFDRVSGCSTKTIQRELAVLVAQGVLTRTGNRRWSRYRYQ